MSSDPEVRGQVNKQESCRPAAIYLQILDPTRLSSDAPVGIRQRRRDEVGRRVRPPQRRRVRSGD